MMVRIQIDRLRVAGFSEGEVRALLERLRRRIAADVSGRGFAPSSVPLRRASAATDGADAVAAALAAALLGDAR